MLIHVPNVLTLDEVNYCRKLLERAPWQDGRVTAGHQSALVKNNLQLPEDSAEAREIGELVRSRVLAHPLFFSAALPRHIFPPLFNCYQGGGHFGVHVDNALRKLPSSDTYIRTDVSCTLFFTNSDEYDGGELVIEDTFGSQAVKLPAGSAIIYPATSLHKVLPVTRGARVASFFWLQSFVASDAHRRRLFELDQAIQKLVLELGQGHEQVVALTGIYHNLLREWSDM